MDKSFDDRTSGLSTKSRLPVVRFMNNSHRLALFSGVFHATRMLIGALQALYLLKSGVSLQNLAFLKSFFALLVLVFDVPFGMLSDFISNKLCIYCSCVFVALYYLFSLYAPDMTYLLIAELFYAMGLCLISGSMESLLIFAVRNEYQGDDSKISYFYFLSGEILSIGSMIAAPLGVAAFIVLGNIQSIYVLSGISMLLLPLLIYTITESHSSQKPIRNSINLSYFKRILFDKKNLIYISVSSLVVMAYQPIYHFWQPLFIKLSEQNLSATIKHEQRTAIILAIVFFIYNLSNYISNKIAKNKFSIHTDSYNSIILLSTLLLSSIVFVILTPETKITLLILVFSCVHGLMTIFSNLSKSVLIAGTEKHQIATVVSLSNVLGRLFSTIILFLCSLLISSDSLQMVFLVTLMSMFIATLIYLKDHSNRQALVDHMVEN